MAAGSIAVTTQRLPLDSNRGATKFTINWTSDASGDVDQVLLKTDNFPFVWYGRIVRVTFVPDSVDIPTHLHHAELLDEEDVDVVAGSGVGLANNESRTVPGAWRLDGSLRLLVSNAGASKKGAVIVHIERQV